jgi:hypothetical protein
MNERKAQGFVGERYLRCPLVRRRAPDLGTPSLSFQEYEFIGK